MNRLLYIARFIPFYREGILKRVSELCESRFVCQKEEFGVGLTPEIEGLERLPLKSILGKLEYFSLKPLLCSYKPNVVISEFGLKFGSVYFLVLARKLWGYKLYFWTHGLEGPRKEGKMWISDYLRIWLMNRADGILYYTQKCAEISHPLLSSPASYVANNTLDTVKLNAAWDIAKATGFNSEPYVVYIGRIVESKRVMELLALAEYLKTSSSSIEIRVAGGGALEKAIEEQARERGLPFRLLGSIVDPIEKARLLSKSLAVVCIGRVGLNIVDAIAFGAPLLTLKNQPVASSHAPEITYLVEGETGWSCESISEMAEHIKDLEGDVNLREKMRKSTRSYFLEECSIERQLGGFEDLLRDSSQTSCAI